MSSPEIQQHPFTMPPPDGVDAQDIAALGALLAGHGLSRIQVRGLLARIQKVSEQLAIMSLAEILEDVRKIQEARLWRIINFVQAMPSVGGYISRASIVNYIHTVTAETPRQ
ncbi:MAG TPA: hypothetical protein VIV15_16910 [Anaerolineales bacterium]